MQRFRIEVGHEHGVKPGQIMGALTNEAGLEGQHIGRIDIRTSHSFVDLPVGMPPEIFKALRKTRLCRQFLRISRDGGAGYKGKGKGTLKSKPMAKSGAKPGAKPSPKQGQSASAGASKSGGKAHLKGPRNEGPPGGMKPPRSAKG